MLFAATCCSSASSSVRNSRVETGNFAALRWRKKSMSMTYLGTTFEQIGQVPFHRWPLAFDDAEHDGIAVAPVGGNLVIAQDTVLLCAESRDRLARCTIEPVGAEFDRDALELFERLGEQHQLALGID